MRTLVLTRDFFPRHGGVATFLFEVTRALTKRGHTLRLITPELSGGEDFDKTLTDFSIHRYPSFEKWPKVLRLPLRALRARQIVRQEIAEFRPDAILCAYANLDGALALATHGTIPYYVICHGTELLRPARHNPLMRRLIRNVLAKAEAIFANSGFTGNLTREKYNVPTEKISVVPLGVPLSMLKAPRAPLPPEYAASGDAPRLLTIAHLGVRKGVDLLLGALSRLPGGNLFVIGEGLDKSRLEQRTREKGLQSRVHFLGAKSREETQGFLDHAHLFVLPSRSLPDEDVEGFGIVFL